MGVSPGYKQTDIGVIPEDWDAVPLDALGKFKNGINKSSEAFGHGSPFVNLMDVFGVSSIASSDLLGLVNTNIAEQQTYDLRKGDVIFIRSSVKPSGIGLTAVLEEDLPKTVYSGFLIRFRDRGILCTGFKRHCFYEEGFRKRVIGASSVSANTNINQDNLKRLLLPLPPTKAEQEAIAGALSEADALIESLEQLLTKKRDLKLGAMQELLSGKKRLAGFEVRPGYKQTEVGIIPEDWPVKPLGQIGESLIGLTYKPADIRSDGILVLRSSNVQEGTLRFDDNVFVDAEVPDRIMVRPGDILICVRNGSRDLIGKCAKIDESAHGMTFGAFMAVFRSSYHDFIYHQFQSQLIKRQNPHERKGGAFLRAADENQMGELQPWQS